MKQPLDIRPIKTVLVTQIALTFCLALVFWFFFDAAHAVSCVLGGGVNVFANIGYAIVMKFGRRRMTAGGTLVHMFTAEAVKVAVMVALLAVVWTFYRGIPATAFFVTFIVTALAFFASLLTKSPQEKGSG